MPESSECSSPSIHPSIHPFRSRALSPVSHGSGNVVYRARSRFAPGAHRLLHRRLERRLPAVPAPRAQPRLRVRLHRRHLCTSHNTDTKNHHMLQVRARATDWEHGAPWWARVLCVFLLRVDCLSRARPGRRVQGPHTPPGRQPEDAECALGNRLCPQQHHQREPPGTTPVQHPPCARACLPLTRKRSPLCRSPNPSGDGASRPRPETSLSSKSSAPRTAIPAPPPTSRGTYGRTWCATSRACRRRSRTKR